MILELALKWNASHRLGAADEARVLREGAYCPRAVWTDHPDAPNFRVIRCRLWGEHVALWLTPNDSVCQNCQHSPANAGRNIPQHRESTYRQALLVGRHIPDTADRIEAGLDMLEQEWGFDVTRQETREALAHIIAAKPIPAEAGLEIARRRGLVE